MVVYCYRPAWVVSSPQHLRRYTMWFLAIIESTLLAIPWIGAMIIGTIVAVYALTIIGWGAVILADLFGYDLCPGQDCEPASCWDAGESE